MNVQSRWFNEAEVLATEARKLSSALWLLLCYCKSPLSGLGYRGRCRHIANLQVRLFWQIQLPEYCTERVTWWHVLGLRSFKTALPNKIAGSITEPLERRRCYLWNAA